MLAAEQFNMYVILRLPATAAAACILLPAPLALLTIISKRGYIPATTIKIAGGGENYIILHAVGRWCRRGSAAAHFDAALTVSNGLCSRG